MAIEYLGLSEVNGPLVVLEGVKNASYEEIVEFTVDGNEKKLGRIVAVYEDKAVIQVFEGTSSMSLTNTHTRLTGHPMEIGLSEEILGEVHGAVLLAGRVLGIQGGDPEHLSGALTVAGGDDRGVDIDKAPLLEELMDRICAEGTNTEDCLEGVGSRTQMRNRTKVFHGVAFFLQRIIRCGNALYGNFCRLNLKRLFCLRGSNEDTFYDDGCADVHFGNLSEVFHLIVVYDLQGFEIASVVQNDETKGFGITYAAHPAAYGYFFVQVCFPVFINLSDGCKFHCLFSP
mgnify:CR=1 FL=1